MMYDLTSPRDDIRDLSSPQRHGLGEGDLLFWPTRPNSRRDRLQAALHEAGVQLSQPLPYTIAVHDGGANIPP